jgi:hypothetical protein
MAHDSIKMEELSTPTTFEESKATPKRRLGCCFWLFLIIAILLLVMGIVVISLLWPGVMEPLVQSATCTVSPEYLKQTAVKLKCTSVSNSSANQTGLKTCKEAEQDMVLECQQGLQGFEDKCPYPYRRNNKTMCATPEGQVNELECNNDITMKVNVKLQDGRQFEQLKFDPDNTTVNFNLDTFSCYYGKYRPKEVYPNEDEARFWAQGDGQSGMGEGLGLLFGWIPFGISIFLLLLLAIYYYWRTK